MTSLGGPTELARANLDNVQALVAERAAAGTVDPARDRVVLGTAEELAGEVSTAATVGAAVQAAGSTQPWWVPVTAILGSLGAIFTTAKTARRKLKEPKTAAAPPASATPPASA